MRNYNDVYFILNNGNHTHPGNYIKNNHTTSLAEKYIGSVKGIKNVNKFIGTSNYHIKCVDIINNCSYKSKIKTEK